MCVQECNKVGFYCENPASTEKQEVDVLLFRSISLVKRFYSCIFKFNIQNIKIMGYKQHPGENWNYNEYCRYFSCS